MAAIATNLDADQVFNIQFTSGTTGTPKGATLTHFNIVNNGFFVGEGMRLTADDRVCIPVPMYHCFGMVLGVLAAMTHAAASVLPGEGFEPLAVLQTVAGERCTALMACRPCSSRNWSIRDSPNSIYRRCAPASCPDRRARSP